MTRCKNGNADSLQLLLYSNVPCMQTYRRSALLQCHCHIGNNTGSAEICKVAVSHSLCAPKLAMHILVMLHTCGALQAEWQ